VTGKPISSNMQQRQFAERHAFVSLSFNWHCTSDKGSKNLELACAKSFFGG
jgi:hypothetical protein